MQYKLYANGVNDDYPAIQEMLDSRVSEVYLPETDKCYRISKTLKIHSGQTLRMSPTTVIKLLPDSNCAMLENDDFYSYIEDVCIDGGIWDMDHSEQEPNPYHFAGKDGKTCYDRFNETGYSFATATAFHPFYSGIAMRFCRVNRFTMKNVTFRNPVVYGVQIGYSEHFTFRDITFDYTEGSPKKWNMDGIHIEGNCKNGYLCNLKGACHDDTVAITSDDSLYGPISDIRVDGIFGHGSHSAVRLLSHGIPVKNIHISNIYGSYYTYCVGMTKYHGGPEERGVMENITVDNVYAAGSVGTEDVGCGNFPFIWVESGLDIKGLKLEHIVRDEHNVATQTIRIDGGATVEDMFMYDIILKNHLDVPIPLLVFDGKVDIVSQIGVISK